jgi:hypothetical protein
MVLTIFLLYLVVGYHKMSVFNALAGNPVPKQIDFLVVGGGGGASRTTSAPTTNSPAGGGGGGVYSSNNVTILAGYTHTIVVGVGGRYLSNAYGVSTSNSGGFSQFHTYYAGGGNTGAYGKGGTSGAAGTSNPGTGYEGSSQSLALSQGNSGVPSALGGGGGGSLEAARNYQTGTNYFGTSITYMTAGRGVPSSITGANTRYGGGGHGQYSTGNSSGYAIADASGGGYCTWPISSNGYWTATTLNGVDGRGGGGSASDATIPNANNTGGSGGSGTVILRTLLTDMIANTTGNPDISTSGIYRIYKWTTAGTYTIRFM